ncbi:hypothetical protein [Nostoc sp.]|uniref:hypothetical protein n=1 Tax=Nostoc sp. TaxID=1180 RepID=UPI002FF529C3
MSETVYIETSVIGYLTARSTKNLIIAANIEITRWSGRAKDICGDATDTSHRSI